MTRRPALAAAAALLALSSPALALQEMKPTRPDELRVGTYTYRRGEIYKVECTMLSTVTIILSEDEDADAGGTINPDKNAYDWDSGGNILGLTCKSETRAKLGRVAILTAYTINRKTKERRPYQFHVTTRPLSADGGTGMAEVRFVYPEDEAKRRAEEAKERAEEARAEAGARRLDVSHYYGRRNRVYWYQAEEGSAGEALAEGLRVSDNGLQTTFEFRGAHSSAAIFFFDETGQKHTISRAPKDGGAVTVARVARSRAVRPETKERWMLQLGDAALCLFNHDPGQDLASASTGTATFDPGVILKPKRRRAGTDAQSAPHGGGPSP